ncbi:hypothetical protein [Streptomyces sp. NPDC050485]|uniref:hypothetical protein n=1 Tax=Streptomyces sp. NPDC050485 TaxID=3365617 RepID=UPI0037A76818
MSRTGRSGTLAAAASRISLFFNSRLDWYLQGYRVPFPLARVGVSQIMNLRRVLTLASIAVTMLGTVAPAAHAADDTAVSVQVKAPDYAGFVKAVRADPIGFVNWKLDLPIPSQYAPIAKP